jgi:hypothetical protein
MKRLILFAALALSIVSCKKDDAPDNGQETTIDYHQTATTKFVTSGDTKYAYRVLGNKEGMPLVMLSPLGSSMDDWDPAAYSDQSLPAFCSKPYHLFRSKVYQLLSCIIH